MVRLCIKHKQNTLKHVLTVRLHLLCQERVISIAVQTGAHIFKSMWFYLHHQVFIVMEIFWVCRSGFWINKSAKDTARTVIVPNLECTVSCSDSPHFVSHIRKWKRNTPSSSSGVGWVQTTIPQSIHKFIPVTDSSQNNLCQLFHLYKLLPGLLV